jgi:hypothetical protein
MKVFYSKHNLFQFQFKAIRKALGSTTSVMDLEKEFKEPLKLHA